MKFNYLNQALVIQIQPNNISLKCNIFYQISYSFTRRKVHGTLAPKNQKSKKVGVTVVILRLSGSRSKWWVHVNWPMTFMNWRCLPVAYLYCWEFYFLKIPLFRKWVYMISDAFCHLCYTDIQCLETTYAPNTTKFPGGIFNYVAIGVPRIVK